MLIICKYWIYDIVFTIYFSFFYKFQFWILKIDIFNYNKDKTI